MHNKLKAVQNPQHDHNKVNKWTLSFSQPRAHCNIIQYLLT